MAVLGFKDDPELRMRRGLSESAIDACLDAMESEMEASEPYRKAVMTARARAARGPAVLAT